MKKVSILAIAIIFALGIGSINAQTSDQFTDNRDGKTYKTVEIGSQVWMAENLAYKASRGCWAYDEKSSNLSKYGYLYNYETAKNVCPIGYHLPTKAEFETLLDNYGGNNDRKANYTALLPSGNSGFSVLFGGFRDDNGKFYGMGSALCFWSSSTEDDGNAGRLGFISFFKEAYVDSWNPVCGFPVRCLQDN